jgi:aminopeptidase N
MLKLKRLSIVLLLLGSLNSNAQELLSEQNIFTRQDTLRGSITPERAWWDLTYYHLNIKVEPDKKFISGSNLIQYKVLDTQKDLQIDLQPPLKITKIIQEGKELEVIHEGNAHFVKLINEQAIGSINAIEVFYEGNPKEAVRAPWDGGFSWNKDNNGNDFVATSCQGLGASVWWPCKDHYV